MPNLWRTAATADAAVDDPFGTEALRARVLRAWAESPARFRADANTEEDFALGGYRDRVVVELAQNAADAALRAGVPGRLRLALRGDVLTAANTGAPLTAEGVEALSTLRASAKRDEAGSVGRFGVGFAAVVSVSDEPSISSASGGVAWSLERARTLVADVPELAAELSARSGHVPLLRLPFAEDEAHVAVPEGFATVVRLPLRDGTAVDRVRAQLGEVGPALLLALPALESVEIDVDGDVREVVLGAWRTVEAHGDIPADLLADRPTEERLRGAWQVRWALPDPTTGPDASDGFGASGVVSAEKAGVPAVLHAPTPSDERIDLPALLIASFPLAPDRRHVAPGPLTDFLIERAADAYVELMRGLPVAPAVLDLVPGPVGAGELDARLRRAILARLPETPLLPGPMRGRDAVALDAPPPFLDLMAEVMPGLLPPGWPVRNPALDALGVRRMEIADVVDALISLERPPAWWKSLYEALSGASTDGLGALPVPLADGRLARGPRGTLITSGDVAALEPLGLRIVHPEAVHGLLTRLGAIEAGPRQILADPPVRAAVEESFDADDPDALAEAVLTLVRDARLDPGDEPWLENLALPDGDGELYAAGELLLPGSPLHAIMADDAPFATVSAELADRFGPETLAAAGVLDGLATLRAEDVNVIGLADAADTLHLDGEEEWAEEVLRRIGDQDLPPLIPEFAAVRDLELVHDWAAALELLARPPLRAAVVEPALVSLDDGRRAGVPSYTAWWLRRHPVLDGRLPGRYRLPDGDDLLSGLYDEAPPGLDEGFLLALGVRTTLDDLLDEPGGAAELLDRMADPAREISREHLGVLWTALAASGRAVEPPEAVRAIVDGRVEVVDAADALVLDRPDLLPLLTGQPLVIAASGAAGTLAELLDLPRASEEVTGTPSELGTPTPVPDAVRAVLPDVPGTYLAHDRLTVDGVDVPWWVGDGEIHAAGPSGLARALAWTSGAWSDRHLAEAVLRDPQHTAALLAEADLEP
ncbi:sacsin N-terminal ATP-binding-like domain-containing protein [Actinomadura gamaensis]|uniref:Sacsin N-terminal ATP-binding-like domain-containing protein n=1 Tax=Actinomadura gamaensis TaxID=1763541 RepID=A0ABV9U2Y8_9ACTN